MNAMGWKEEKEGRRPDTTGFICVVAAKLPVPELDLGDTALAGRPIQYQDSLVERGLTHSTLHVGDLGVHRVTINL